MNPIDFAWGNFIQSYVHTFYTIYMHKYKGKFKCNTTVGIKITLDPQW